MLKILFCYYHLFYQNIFKDNDSYFTAKLAFTDSESFLVITLLDITSTYFFCYSVNKYWMAGITLLLLLINFIILAIKK